MLLFLSPLIPHNSHKLKSVSRLLPSPFLKRKKKNPNPHHISSWPFWTQPPGAATKTFVISILSRNFPSSSNTFLSSSPPKRVNAKAERMYLFLAQICPCKLYCYVLARPTKNLSTQLEIWRTPSYNSSRKCFLLTSRWRQSSCLIGTNVTGPSK